MIQTASLLQQTQSTDIFQPSMFEFGANLTISLTCGVLVSLVYRFVRRHSDASPAFAHALLLLCLITTIVTLVIGNNLARAFSLVGTMSIIRFRTAVRDVEDIVFIFFSLAMGMAAGVSLNSVALVGTVLICVVILVLHALSDSQPQQVPTRFVQIAHDNETDMQPALRKIFKRYAQGVRLLNTRNA